MEIQTLPTHEKIFNEICTKLNELSQTDENKSSKDKVLQLEKMQNQLKNFQFDLMTNHEDMKLKIESLEKMTVSNSDLSQRIQELTEMLNQERAFNSKLSSDLARSLDLSLKLQLEVQDIKTKAMQAQAEDRKQYLENYENLQFDFQKQKMQLLDLNSGLNTDLKSKESQISHLNSKINEIETNMNAIEETSQEQKETIQHLMTVAENKIVELKLSLDRTQADKDNLSGQFTQANAQVDILKQENYTLKDYINKMSQYYQQYQQQLTTATQSIRQNS
jgi:chromosome segregation ATPase